MDNMDNLDGELDDNMINLEFAAMNLNYTGVHFHIISLAEKVCSGSFGWRWSSPERRLQKIGMIAKNIARIIEENKSHDGMD